MCGETFCARQVPVDPGAQGPNSENPLEGITGNWFGAGPILDEVERGRLVVVGWPVDGLVRQHRQVLRHRVSKQRPEDADVVASSVAHANHGLGSDFIRDSKRGANSL